MNIIGRGAEAVTYLEDSLLVKKRESKLYRLKVLDDKIIKSRTKAEVKLLNKLRGFAPKVVSHDKNTIKMEYLKGPLLRDVLDKEPSLAKKLALTVSKMHDLDVVHGDLTTSNIVVSEDQETKLIDFGLGKVSKRYEDKAVDLHVFKESLVSKHHKVFNQAWNFFLQNYKAEDYKKILERLDIVESRGRNKKK